MGTSAWSRKNYQYNSQLRFALLFSSPCSDASDAETAGNASTAEIPQPSPSTSLGAQFTFSMDLDGRYLPMGLDPPPFG